MPVKTKISTKTTRNTDFNYYESQYQGQKVINTVTSATATKDNKNIRLLDVDNAIVKKGNLISDDAYNNTVLIEISTGFNDKISRKIRDYAINGKPADPKGAAEYDKYEAILVANKLSYEKIAAMVINYKNGDALNSDAGINFDKTADYYIFGAPDQVVLNNRQNYYNCGVESTLNNLAMAGIVKMKENLKDQEKVEKNFLQQVWERNLADDSYEIGELNETDGGTTGDDYRDIMEYFGIKSKAYYISTKTDDLVYPKAQINELAYKISQGYGAVLCVCSSILWNDAQSETGQKKIDHAIAITGVVYDTPNPTALDNPVGFYIHDTGAWMTRFISYDEFVDATLCNYVYGPEDTESTLKCLQTYESRLGTFIRKEEEGIFITLTDEPIKVDTFKLDVTGNKYDNMLWGNSSDNLIKGMAGNDTLYGGAGRDEIYGGAGNDVIVGNEAYKLKVKNDMEQIIYESNTVENFKEYITDETVKAKLDKVELKDYGTLTVEEFIKLGEVVPRGINTLYGDAGNDIIIGGEDADLIYGGAGNDYIWGGFGRNAIYGGAGNDLIIGGYDNDRLFGEAGNDTIYGFDDDDVIDGGAGNDHISGGRGNDKIELGKGNDTVYFEGKDHGIDTVTAQSGNTVFKFVDNEVADSAAKVSEMFLSFDTDSSDNNKAFLITYKESDLGVDDSAIAFDNFYNTKTGKSKTLKLDAADGKYDVTATKKSKISLAKSKINNILYTTYDKGVTVTTSNKDDIVNLTIGDRNLVTANIDKISYTKGKDIYKSEVRDTYYTTGAITAETNLSIYDNVVAVETEEDPYYVSKDDRLYLGMTNNANYLFDVSIDDYDQAITTANSGLYLLNNTNYVDIVNGDANGGFIYMDSFLWYDDENTTHITGNDFYGNGQIEGLYYKGSQEAYDYNTDITSIAGQVANWLANDAYNPWGYESSFKAFENFDNLSEDAQIALVDAYSVPA